MRTMAAKTLLKCGYLLKRQRGQSVKADLKKLKFQQRYMNLDTKTLDYFEDQKGTVKKGSFPVERIRIVENVPDVTFGRPFYFQIGDEKEIMYFRAKSDQDRKEWMEAFRIGASINENEMYDWYHTGAYGQVNSNKWSCCNEQKREAKGCRKTVKFSQRPRMASLSAQWQQQRPHDDQSTTTASTISEEFSTSVPAYLSSSNWGDKEAQDEMNEDYLLEDSEEEQKKEKHNYRRSVDSGVLVETGSRNRVGSYGSVASTQGASYSPTFYRRQHSRVQASLSLHTENVIPGSNSTSSWKLLHSIKFSESRSKISSVTFRGTSTLITASKEGHVHVIDATDPEVCRDLEHLSATALGTVDVWKNYLVVGFPNSCVIDLDNRKEKITLKNCSTEGLNYAQFVSLTPEGQLLSYSKAEPCSIYIWPHSIDLLWQNLSNHEAKADPLIIEGAQEIQSLSVSPDPDQPLMAVVVLLKGVPDQRKIRLYNYKTREVKQELKLHEKAKSKPAITAFHPHEDYVLIGNGRSLLFYNIKTVSYKVHSIDLKNDAQYITSLCFYPTGSHLTIGLNTGEVRSFNGLPSSLQLVATLSKPQTPITASSVTYSKDCQILAIGHGNGTVQLWQVPRLSMLKSNSDSLLLRENELIVTSDGAYFISPDDGYIISVPPGAVAKGETVTLKHGIVPHGGFSQFQFPEGMYPISTIVSVLSTTKHKFRKPIEIVLPHCINCETPDDCNKLAVFKACHTIVKNGLPTYRFEKMPNRNLSHFAVRSKENGTVMPYIAYSAEHCCFWCVGTYSKKDTDKAMFCLTEARPKSTEGSNELAIHYCLSYHLPTCLRAVEEQFPEEDYILKHLTVIFSDEKDPVINIEFEKDAISGWTLLLQGGDKVYKKDLCFWDYPSTQVLVKMCQMKQYPPRFILEVNGHRATESVVTRVSFPGAKEFFKRTVPFSNVTLTCHSQGYCAIDPGFHHNISGHSLASSTSDPSSPAWPTTHPFQLAMAEFTDISPVKLSFHLLSQNIITEEECDSASQPGDDPEEHTMKILMKVNRIIKETPQKIGAVCAALERLKGKKDIAKKLAKDSESYERMRVRKSRSGSAESSSSVGAGSFASAQERFPEQCHALTGAVEAAESSTGHDHHDVEQTGEVDTTESSPPSHIGSSYDPWVPVSCMKNASLLQPFYSLGDPDLILSGDELPNPRQSTS